MGQPVGEGRQGFCWWSRVQEQATICLWYKEGLKSPMYPQEKEPMTTVAFPDVFAKLPAAELEASLQMFTRRFGEVLPG